MEGDKKIKRTYHAGCHLLYHILSMVKKKNKKNNKNLRCDKIL